ncbi:MAG: hypothetical protein KGI54_16505 [Pseudomonadota bacterium]|nr:hypothetical protein [Pseudomonadota bacterium]
MTTAYIFPPNGYEGKSQAFSALNDYGFLGNFDTTDTYQINIVSGTISNPYPNGTTEPTMASDSDVIGNGFWGATASGSVYFQNLQQVSQIYEGGGLFTGTAVVSGVPYLVTADSKLWSLLGGTSGSLSYQPLTVSSGGTAYYLNVNSNTLYVQGNGIIFVSDIPANTGLSYAASANVLYSIDGTTNQVGGFNLSTSGVFSSSPPVTYLQQLIGSQATSGVCAVFGTSFNSTASSYQANNLAISPDNLFGAFANPTNNTVNLMTITDPSYSVVNSFTASGTAYWCAWNPLGTQVLTTNTGGAYISIYGVAGSSLSLFQVLSIAASGTTQIIPVPNTSQMLCCNPSNNYIDVLDFSGTWSVYQTVAATEPTCLTSISSTTAYAGVSGAIAELTYASNAWSITNTTSLAYTPTDILQTSATNVICAVGYSGSTGYLSVIYNGSLLEAQFTGTPKAVYEVNGQIIVPTNSGTVYIYSYLTNQLILKSTINIVSGTVTSITSSGQSLFFCASDIFQYYFDAPFEIAAIPYGWVATYDAIDNSWSSITSITTAFSTPMAATWQGSNIYLAAEDNTVYICAFGGGITGNYTVTNYNGLLESAIPAGISKLLWLEDGHLYGSTSLNSALLKVA